jgi:CheY-like chemotaxis protein
VVANAGSGETPTLLLVDDCVAERDLYEITLKPGFNILTAGRGLDGLTLAIARKPDVIVLDVKMPGLDGWETCTRIKSHPATADIPVILLTGADDVDLSQHAVAVGASAVLSKPCPADRLKAQILTALGGQNRGRASFLGET